jgi:simple sugar transport system ATP-binding protein
MTLLEARDIGKRYGAVRANDAISFRIDPGEIVGLVGENGAGKSTLLSILAGFLAPDTGQLIVEGVPRRFRSAGDALAAGIGLVHQHLSLVPTFTVREQLALAGWTGDALHSILGRDIPGEAPVERLSLGQRQRLEIARALVTRPRLLLLDEPTSILAPSEVSHLFGMLEEIRSQGAAVVIVSHKLREIMQVVDRVVVLAKGQVTGTFSRSGRSWPPGVDRQILGRMFDLVPNAKPGPNPVAALATPEAAGAIPVLTARAITSAAAPGSHALHGIDLDIVPGQIHVVVGVDGQGQTGLAEAIAGYRDCQGTIAIDGESMVGKTAVQRAAAGIALMAGDRLGEAGIAGFSVMENLVLKRPRPDAIARWGLLRRAGIRDRALHAIESWAIRPSNPAAPFATLSGGNMQRVVAAREIDPGPRILIAMYPAQGLDARTTDQMWTRMRQLANSGSGILVFVSDIDEALTHADRIAVMYGGSLTRMTPVAGSSREAIASSMVGG